MPNVAVDLDAVPITNEHRFELQNAMRRGVRAEDFELYIWGDTWLNKLSWHERYQLYDNHGKPTVYKRYLEMKIV